MAHTRFDSVLDFLQTLYFIEDRPVIDIDLLRRLAEHKYFVIETPRPVERDRGVPSNRLFFPLVPVHSTPPSRIKKTQSWVSSAANRFDIARSAETSMATLVD